ncbi:MAG: 23S rRNA (uracil(1939)-C(5))-methyltransferase RlmD [Pseudomonadales bacterium]|nr:23S rRNA (uracil(1939)-C(5))-methyltransferase RlmD [Pseudomonadales bacterium]
MQPKEPVLVNVRELHEDGYCTTNAERLVVYGALPGETVMALPFTRRKRKVFARTLAVETASPDRVAPICAVAAECGGCSLQHLEPSRQLAMKQEKLLSLLRETPPDVVMRPLIGPVSAYRTKARFGAKFVAKKGKVLVGFREKMSPWLTETQRCEILAAPVGTMVAPLAELIGNLTVKDAIPQVEIAVGEDRTALVFRHLAPLSAEDTGHLVAFGGAHDVDIYLQPGNQDSVYLLAGAEGPERLHYSLPDYGLTFSYHPLDFTQINLVVNKLLVARAIELLELSPADRVMDLFCGIGNFSLPIARYVGEVMGLEGVGGAVARANENAVQNALSNVSFGVADLFLGETPEIKAFGPNKVLLDPPRAGAEAVCKILASHKVERVVYVSCNPDTLARDARILVKSGYRMDKAGVVDMFPHTTHVESIACFSNPQAS